jgi:Na+/H+ antiporter NhaD/arsenite permease-like protein
VARTPASVSHSAARSSARTSRARLAPARASTSSVASQRLAAGGGQLDGLRAAAKSDPKGAIKEVAKLFAGIFICMLPVLAMLKAGKSGAFAPLVALVTNPDGSANNAAYFWLTGALSSFLDNAPTYLVFFELAGGDPQKLMTSGALTLAAISSGAVYMGANSYIGNAPNFMVKAIVEENGVRMPSFFGYVGWAMVFLVPLFILVTFLFFL